MAECCYLNGNSAGSQYAANFNYTVLKNSGGENLRYVAIGCCIDLMGFQEIYLVQKDDHIMF